MSVAFALCVSLAWLGCGKTTQEYRMGQTINMGLFSFEVERTEQAETLAHPSEGPILEIRVYYRMLNNKTPPFGRTFDESLLDVRIVDKAENVIQSSGRALVSGDRHHPSQWCDIFTVSSSLMGIRDRDKLGRTVSDFRLIIDNPDVRSDQPERVFVQLR